MSDPNQLKLSKPKLKFVPYNSQEITDSNDLESLTLALGNFKIQSENPNYKIESENSMVNNSDSDKLNLKNIDFVCNNSISVSKIINNKSSTMSPPTDNSASLNSVTVFNEIFNCLKIPDAVKDLPTFEGNVRTLYDFIDNVEEILSLISGLDGTSYAKVIMRAIRNKIVGQANEVLNMYGTPLKWENVKKNLITHYADKRNETSLIRDLHLLRQGQETVEKFYSKIIEIFSTIINHIKMHESDANVIIAKQKLYEEMCLNTFLSGLKEPLGSTIRAMRPGALAEALNFCLTEQNTYYVRNTQLIKPVVPIRKPPMKLNPLPSSPHAHASAFPTPTYNPPHNARFNFPKPQQPFQQNFISHQTNSQRTNLNSRNRPEPMDTSSGQTNFRSGRFPPQPNRTFQSANNPNTNRFFQPTGTPNFTSEELFNVEYGKHDQEVDLIPNDDLHQPNYQDRSQDLPENNPFSDYQDYQNLDNWYQENQIDDRNFRQTASETQ